LDWIGKTRRQMEWEVGGLTNDPNELPLSIPEPEVHLRPVTRPHALALEFGMTGVSLHEHPMELYRPSLRKRHILNSRQVTKSPVNTRIEVAGLNVMHQFPPTAKGFYFITLEDEFGFMNVIVRPQVFVKYRSVLLKAKHLVIYGTVQRDDAVTNVLASAARMIGRE
jgi:error-prone DNA polymerase